MTDDNQCACLPIAAIVSRGLSQRPIPACPIHGGGSEPQPTEASETVALNSPAIEDSLSRALNNL